MSTTQSGKAIDFIPESVPMNAEEHAATENLRLGDLSEAQVAKDEMANSVSESLKTESYASTVESSSVKTSSTASEVMSKSEKAKSVAAQKIDSLRAGVRQSEKDLWISKLEAKSIRTEYRELKIAQEDYAMQLRLVKASKGSGEEKIAAMQSKLVELESKVKATVTSKNQRYAAALEDVKKNELAVAGAKAKLNANTGMFERISSKLQSMIRPATVTQEQELAKLRLDFQTALSDVNVGRRLDEKAQAQTSARVQEILRNRAAYTKEDFSKALDAHNLEIEASYVRSADLDAKLKASQRALSSYETKIGLM